MKTSLNWLNSYVDRPADVDQVAHVMTNIGFETARDECEQVCGARDWRLEVDITSNRPDCLSHLGQARELAAATSRTLIEPDSCIPDGLQSAESAGALTSVVCDDLQLCPLYTARVIRGVKVAPSPAWLVERLEAVGLRSVNNVVDVTNFVMLELGQPLHAFDMNILAGRRIIVRRARPKEPFEAIDGSKHQLAADMLVIADEKRPVAVGGVMGGLNTQVTDRTTDILLEAAMFDRLSVRQTSRAMKLASDSSYRFERGVDPVGVDTASRRAARLIVELAGGKVAKGVIRVGADEPARRPVAMRVARCNMLLGLQLDADHMLDILGRLKLDPRLDANTQTLHCTIPTYRLDLEREVDLIEEVGRLHGLEAVPVRDKIVIEARPLQPVIQARQKMRDVLAAHGYHEAVTFVFMPEKVGRVFLSAGEEAVLVDDERRRAEPMLRPSILPSLLACRKSNQDVGNSSVRLFETSATWSRRGGQIVESDRLCLICDASDSSEALRRLRSAIEEMAEHLGVADDLSITATDAPHYAAAAQVAVADQPIGVMGLLDQAAADMFDLQTAIVAAELLLEPLLRAYPPRRHVTRLLRQPGIERDLSIVLDESVQWSQIRQQIDHAKLDLLEDIQFLGVYRGKPIAAGRKSVSFRMAFRDPQATLRHEQVDPQVAAVVDRLSAQLGATLRT